MASDVKILFFDYYMTLVKLENPFEQIKKWMSEYLANYHSGIDSHKFYSRFTKYRAFLSSDGTFRLGAELLSQSLEKTCQKFSLADFSKEFVSFINDLFGSVRAYDDALFVINRLRESFTVGLLTNADNDIIMKPINREKFGFDFIITSEDAKSNKPDAKIFQYALSQLKIKPKQALMIGDSQFDDLYGAQQAGIRSVWINRNHEALKEGIHSPAFEVDNLTEILNIIDKV